MVRVAMFSGGKESLFAAFLRWPPDLFLLLVYDFPRPSPHTLNIRFVLESAFSLGIPVLVHRLPKGKEFECTVELLRVIGAKEIIAGDVQVEEHLKYMEKLASEAGAKLYEPLWSRNTEELLHEELKYELEPLIIGCVKEMKEWIVKILTIEEYEKFISYTKLRNIDPIGEKGEYHTLVINSPHHKYKIQIEAHKIIEANNYVLAKLT